MGVGQERVGMIKLEADFLKVTQNYLGIVFI